MHFKLVYENHGNFGLHVSDHFLYLKYALESLGHRADIEYEFCPGEFNIVMECFNDQFTEKVEKLWIEGTAMIIVATEFLTGDTFNNIYQEEQNSSNRNDQNQRKDFWSMRYKNFQRLLPKCTAIWHFSDQQAPIYQQAFPDTPVHYLPFSYSDSFKTVNHRPDSEKDIDVLFTGTLTTERTAILESLQDNGLVVKSSILFTAPFHRDDLIARSKLVINIKQHPNWQHESVGRIFYHLSNASLLITETCKYQSDLHDFVIEKQGSWLDAIQEQLDIGNYCERGLSASQQFMRERPASVIMASLLTSVPQTDTSL